MLKESPIDLTIIVTIVGGGEFLGKCLDQLITQINGRFIEIIVPSDSTVKDLLFFKQHYPQIKFLDIGVIKTAAPPGTQAALIEVYDFRIAKGLSASKGKIIAILQDYAIPDNNWCENILEAHKLPYGVIGGAVEHIGNGVLNWAVYFMDFGRYQLPFIEGASKKLTDVNISYKRAIIMSVQDLWKDRYEEMAITWELSNQGVVFWQDPNIVASYDRGKLTLSKLLSERYQWGKQLGLIRVRDCRTYQKVLFIVLSPVIPFLTLAKSARNILLIKRRNRIKFLISLPAILLLSFAWSFGELMGYLTGHY